jgi:protein TonB
LKGIAMQLALNVQGYHRNIGFAVVIVLHGLVAWLLVNSKIRLPLPQAVDSAVLALITRAPATQAQAGGGGGSGVPALSGGLAPKVNVAVEFVPVSIEEPPRVSVAQAESRPAAMPPIAMPAPVAPLAGNGAGAGAAGAIKAGADEVDYDSLPAAMLAIDCESPPYPREAIDKAQSGTTRLALLIDAQGRVVESRVVRSSKAPSLDRAAREAIANCQFIPAMRNGVAAQGWVMLNYIWTLHLKPGVIR